MTRISLLLACTVLLVLGAPGSPAAQSKPSAKPLWEVYPLDPPPSRETEQPPEQPASESGPASPAARPSAPAEEPSSGGPPVLLVAVLAALGLLGLALALVLLTRLAPGVVPAGLPAVLRQRGGSGPRDEPSAGRTGVVAGVVRRRVAAFTSSPAAPERAPEALRAEAEEALASVKEATERTLASVRTEAEQALVALKVEAERSVAESEPRSREAAREAARAAIQSEMEETIASIRAAADEAIDSIKADADLMRMSLREEASETLASIRTEAEHAGPADADPARTLPSIETTAARTRAAMRARVQETLAAMQAQVDEATVPAGHEELDEPDDSEEPGAVADVGYEACEIAWLHGKHRGYFFAHGETPDGSDLGRSAFLRWHEDEPPPESGPMAAAQQALVRKLAEEGWEPYDRGEAWYAQRLRRPLRR